MKSARGYVGMAAVVAFALGSGRVGERDVAERDKVVAVVNGQAVTWADLEDRPRCGRRRDVLDRLVRLKLAEQAEAAAWASRAD